MAIAVLPAHLVNRIAAGEVIERPASVVKELVENSIDAGADRVDVAIADGGRKLIQVTDNGCGMGPEDLALAFRPHATSKLAGEDDLFAIATLGFRGEALASIASISHAKIQTRRRDDAGGCEIEVAGEAGGQVRPCPAAPGTTTTIRDLFFNTPARRKFMRTAGTEIGHVAEQLNRLALPHPQVAFTLKHNGREMKNLPAAAGTAQRATDLFGQELGEALLPIVRRGGGKVTVAGLVAPRPGHAPRANGSTSSSTGGTSATGCSRTRSARRSGGGSIPTAGRQRLFSSRSRPPRWTSTSTRPRSKSASRTARPYTARCWPR